MGGEDNGSEEALFAIENALRALHTLDVAQTSAKSFPSRLHSQNEETKFVSKMQEVLYL